MTREELEKKKEMILEFISSKEYRPVSAKEMGAILQVPAKEKKLFHNVIDELRSEGKLHLDPKGKIRQMSDDLLEGIFMATQKGFGFVRVEGEKEDIYIPAEATKGAMEGDRVRIALNMHRNGRKQEAEVVSILERGMRIVVGTYSIGKSYGTVVPDNYKFPGDIYIAKADTKGAITGHKVVVEITDFGSEQRNPEGRVLEILGHINDPGIDILSVIKAYGLPEEFPDEVMAQAEKIADEVPEEDKRGRTDYRNLQTVTIDGEDAKDLDDAVTLEKESGIYRLGVHIADVSQYVTEHSPLDKEALKRGTSVYLVDRVIPMLPHKLSNGICSLNQGEDRLALSCIMDINSKGEVVKHKIEETLIRVDKRMSYTSVHKIIDERDEAERKEYEELIPMFERMYELAGILRERRFKKGSVDFDFPESKITLDEKGKPLDVAIYERNNAHRIIEEFMLIANQTVAEEYFWQEQPFVYRTHESPDEEKIQKLSEFVTHFGYSIKIGSDDEIHPKEIQKLIRAVEGKPEEAVVSRLALRSMKQAKYTDSCEGHFGLAMKYYCHFTSPIRRYPDLQIHRIIKENLHGRLTEKRQGHYQKILPEVAAQASRLERRADEAEREVEKMKKAEYMEQFIGETFDGVISGVTTWGIYVELPNTIEGMVRVSDIPGDYYYFEEENYRMTGERTHKTYELGQQVKVVADQVDKMLRTIDFRLVEEEMENTVEKDARPAAGTDQTDRAAQKAPKEKARKKKVKLTSTGEPFSKKEKRRRKEKAREAAKKKPEQERNEQPGRQDREETERQQPDHKEPKVQAREAAKKKPEQERKEQPERQDREKTERQQPGHKAPKVQAREAAKRQAKKGKKKKRRLDEKRLAEKRAALKKRQERLAKKKEIERAFAKIKRAAAAKESAKRRRSGGKAKKK